SCRERSGQRSTSGKSERPSKVLSVWAAVVSVLNRRQSSSRSGSRLTAGRVRCADHFASSPIDGPHSGPYRAVVAVSNRRQVIRWAKFGLVFWTHRQQSVPRLPDRLRVASVLP